jgi:hypothetical protein
VEEVSFVARPTGKLGVQHETRGSFEFTIMQAEVRARELQAKHNDTVATAWHAYYSTLDRTAR